MGTDVATFLRGIAAELADIHRGKHYTLWRGEAASRVDRYLSAVEPFAEFANSWIFTGDGGGCVVSGRFGDWAIDRLVEKLSPEEVIERATEELGRNSAVYVEVSPLLGIEIDAECELAPGIRLVPGIADVLDRSGPSWRFNPSWPSGSGSLAQSFTVTPAFETRDGSARSPRGESETVPGAAEREVVRRRVRLACLLASPGAVELPFWLLQPDRMALMAAGEGSRAGRPFALHPLVSMPVETEAITRNYELLGQFTELGSLERAVDRLGRSRLAVSPVDRALDLGMAAEIALMHDNSPSNTEITFKIAGRAAWLLGSDADDRTSIFAHMKRLYRARSAAVHSGELPSRAEIDLDAADFLVTRALRTILQGERFPDWMKLTMGAH